MTLAGVPPQQMRHFKAVIAGLKGIGYQGELLKTDYAIRDWFHPDRPERTVPAAAFGQTPVSYDNACFAVLLSNSKSDTDLIADYRALGAPRAFEVRDDCVLHWRVSSCPSIQDQQENIKPEDISAVFDRYADEWRPENVLRAKNITAPGPRQMDFIDLGLIPALEDNIRQKLDPLLGGILHGATKTHKRSTHRKPNFDELFRLVFRALTGKVMFDRGLRGFRSFSGFPDPDVLLQRVENHYRDRKPAVTDPATRQYVVQELWQSISFQNLSVAVLAHIWENTLVSASTRRSLSIHATPPAVARYIVNRLPIEDIPQSERRIVEPCCGCGTFMIAALQRLRELLPPALDEHTRHSYFAKMLSGFDIESFGQEVARSCLTLADFPNPNGWVLEQEDVFEDPERTPRFNRALDNASVILCNPPFGDFTPRDRKRYKLRSVHKPAELLLRILERIKSNALLGFVLPRVFLDGSGYRDVRHRLGERYEEVEIVNLPDKVFEQAEHETALLMTNRPRGSSRPVSVLHGKVKDADRSLFLSRHQVSREEKGIRTIDVLRDSIAVVDLNEIWECLAEFPTVRDATDGSIHRGIEWNIPLTRRDRKTGKWVPIPENTHLLISDTPKEGFKRGLKGGGRELFSFQCPRVSYLCVKPQFRRTNVPFERPWAVPKVVMNSKRKSRGPWRIAAFADESGLVCYQSFTSLWPNQGPDIWVLAACLNGPVANAFVSAHEGNRDITKETIQKIPMPLLSRESENELRQLVGQYVLTISGNGIDLPETGRRRLRGILRRIDGVLLKGYHLAPRLERQLLEYFRGHNRPVPFDFGDYYPADFKPYVPLWMYDSDEFQKSTAANFLKNAPTITDPELVAILNEIE